MRQFATALIFLIAASSGPVSAAPPKLTGSWEAARTSDDERLYLVLKDMGKAEVIAEYNFTLPGQPGNHRGRSISFAKWKVQGDEIVVSYAKIRDRLRYQDHESLRVLGLEGMAAALKPVGKPNPKSKIGSLILWKAPHEYRVKAPAGAITPQAESTAPANAEPVLQPPSNDERSK